MPKRLRAGEPPLICQRRFERSRVEQQFWSEAYEQLVPEGRRSPVAGDSGVPCRRKQVQGVPLSSDLMEGKCA